MPLPSSGIISASDINEELGKSSTALLSLNASDIRDLADVPSGEISFSDFYGKSAIHIKQYSGESGNVHSYTDCDFGPEFTGRRIFVAIFTENSEQAYNISEVVIGGVNATGAGTTYFDSAGVAAGAAIYFADVEGESGEVSFDSNTDNSTSAIVIVALDGGITSIHDDDSSDTGTNPGGSTTVDVDTDGILFSAYCSTSLLSPTFTGATRRIYGTFGGSRYSLAFDFEMTLEAARVVSVSAVSGDAYVMQTISFT